MTQAETRTAEGVDELRRSLEGDAVVPGDVQYDAARICFNALIDRRPAVIVRCLGRADVATAFDFARTNEPRSQFAEEDTTRQGTAFSMAGW